MGNVTPIHPLARLTEAQAKLVVFMAQAHRLQGTAHRMATPAPVRDMIDELVAQLDGEDGDTS